MLNYYVEIEDREIGRNWRFKGVFVCGGEGEGREEERERERQWVCLWVGSYAVAQAEKRADEKWD